MRLELMLDKLTYRPREIVFLLQDLPKGRNRIVEKQLRIERAMLTIFENHVEDGDKICLIVFSQ